MPDYIADTAPTLAPLSFSDVATFSAAIRERVATAAQAVVGDGMRASRRAAFLQLIAAGETVGRAVALGHASTCGLVVRGVLRRCGFVDPRLVAPYKVGAVMASISELAHEAGAWRSSAELVAALEADPSLCVDELADVGDVLFFGDPEHVAIVGRPLNLGGGTFTYDTIEGGQVVQGEQSILAKRRAVVVAGGKLVADPPYNRTVLAVVDVAKLAKRFHPDAPADA